MEKIVRYNVVLKLDLIIGLPEETYATYLKGLDFFIPVLKNTDHVLNIHRLQILPGSELEEITAKYNISYSIKAPHMVFSTSTMTEDDFMKSSRITAAIFRILNSPFRPHMFKYIEEHKMTPTSFADDILEGIQKHLPMSRLADISSQIDDDYWNSMVFNDIPSKWIEEYLKCH